MEEQYMSQYQHADKKTLEETKKELKEKLDFFISESRSIYGQAKYANKKETENINVELSAIEKLLINKSTNP